MKKVKNILVVLVLFITNVMIVKADSGLTYKAELGKYKNEINTYEYKVEINTGDTGLDHTVSRKIYINFDGNILKFKELLNEENIDIKQDVTNSQIIISYTLQNNKTEASFKIIFTAENSNETIKTNIEMQGEYEKCLEENNSECDPFWIGGVDKDSKSLELTIEPSTTSQTTVIEDDKINNNNNNNKLFYVSAGLNFILLTTLLIVIVKKKKQD